MIFLVQIRLLSITISSVFFVLTCLIFFQKLVRSVLKAHSSILQSANANNLSPTTQTIIGSLLSLSKLYSKINNRFKNKIILFVRVKNLFSTAKLVFRVLKTTTSILIFCNADNALPIQLIHQN